MLSAIQYLKVHLQPMEVIIPQEMIPINCLYDSCMVYLWWPLPVIIWYRKHLARLKTSWLIWYINQTIGHSCITYLVLIPWWKSNGNLSAALCFSWLLLHKCRLPNQDMDVGWMEPTWLQKLHSNASCLRVSHLGFHETRHHMLVSPRPISTYVVKCIPS